MFVKKGASMKSSKFNLLTMSVWTRVTLACVVLIVLWLAIAWALGGAI
jgi:hypothetical protein